MSTPAIVAIVVFVLLFIVVTVIHNRNYRRRMRSLAAERAGESICQFARSLPYRQLDTSVIRHVYTAVQAQVAIPGCHVPLRASDDCTDTLEIDPEDFEYLVAALAERCGRSLNGYKQNPFYGRVQTVGGLIQFLCAQPKS